MPNLITRRKRQRRVSVYITPATSGLSNVDSLFLVTISFAERMRDFYFIDVLVARGACVDMTTTDYKTYTAYINPDKTGDITISIPQSVCKSVIGSFSNKASNSITVTASADWVSLSTPSFTKGYWDFREGVGLNTDTITTDDPSLRDLSGNNITLGLINAPAIRARGASEPGIVGLRDTLTQCVSIGSNGVGIFDRDFAVNFRMQSNDGIGASFNLCGNTDAGGNKGFIVTINATGNILVAYQSNALGFVWTSTNPVLTDGQTIVTDFFVNCDFTNDILTVKQDGVNVAGSFTTRDIASTDPTTYAATTDFYIGALNTDGVASSNANTNSIYYFAITGSQGTTSSIRTYLNAKKPCIELVATLTDATYLKNPHYVEFSPDRNYAYVSGKGATSAVNVDGSFGVVNISNPAIPVMTGGYSGQSDQVDGETIHVHSATRAIHFVNGGALLFDISNPASPTKIRTVSHASGANSVGNGYGRIGNYLFSANKSGYIDVFDISVIDSFTLVGSWDVKTLYGMTGPHDAAVSPDGNHIIFVSRSTGAQFGIVKVMNAGVLIPIASWTLLASITSATISQANRVDVYGNTATVHCLDTGGDAIVTIDISNLASPSILDSFSLLSPTANASGSAGKGRYRGKYSVCATWLGVRLIDVTTNPSAITQGAGYMNATTFTAGTNQNFHECPTFVYNGSTYIFMTCQNDGIAIFKINDRLQ